MLDRYRRPTVGDLAIATRPPPAEFGKGFDPRLSMGAPDDLSAMPAPGIPGYTMGHVATLAQSMGCSMRDALAQLRDMVVNVQTAAPMPWARFEGANPGFLGVGMNEPLGLGVNTLPPLAAGVPGTVTLTAQAQKELVAERLVLNATTAAGTQLAHVTITNIVIGGRTFSNNGNDVPLSSFLNVDSFAQFNGARVLTSQQVSVTFRNFGADPVTVSGAVIGHTRE